MREIRPAYLTRFVHPVSVGAVIPAGTEHVARTADGVFSLHTYTYDLKQKAGYIPRWTAAPIPVPEPTLAERTRALRRGRVWSPSDLDQLVLIVAELAEKVEGDR